MKATNGAIWYSDPDEYNTDKSTGVITKKPSPDKRVKVCQYGQEIPAEVLKHGSVKSRLEKQGAISEDPLAVDPRKKQIADESNVDGAASKDLKSTEATDKKSQ